MDGWMDGWGRDKKIPPFSMSPGPGRGRVKVILFNLNVKLFGVAGIFVIVLDKENGCLKVLAR